VSLRPLVQRLVELVVDEPAGVKVEEADDRGAKVYYVTCEPDDVGRVIGKNGRVVNGIRQIVGAAGAKARHRTFVKIDSD
jgi:predicted RNA-binding protein YlqC (UPF0109 family)